MTSKLSGTFGYQNVPPDERERRIREVFARVAPRYDLMNDLMSFGIHRFWKRAMARAVQAESGERIVDLAGGTGDVARLLAGRDRSVLVCDPSLQMMIAGRTQRDVPDIQWVAGTGERLPFPDASIDAVTIAFGIRNVTHMNRALAEIHRALKPGGRFFCLEFSRPWAPIRPFYNLFSFAVIPRLGAWVSGTAEAYAYLVESIRRFPSQEEMKSILVEAGFANVRYRNLTFGIACVHSGHKPHHAI